MTSVTEEERCYFDQMPAMFPVYVQLKERLEQRYENIRVKVTKTQISFSNRYIFTVVSLPWRRHKGWPEKYLLVSFGLDYEKGSPRIIQAVEAGRRRWTHHVLVEDKDGIDEELMQWIDEAYRFSLFK